jgi:hypothetical protein
MSKAKSTVAVWPDMVVTIPLPRERAGAVPSLQKSLATQVFILFKSNDWRE